MPANLEIPGHIALVTGSGGLTKALVTTPWSQAEIYLHGAHITHFQKTGDVAKLLGDKPGQIVDGQHSVASRFFEVRGRLRLDQTTVQERSLVQRDGLDVKTLWRDRGIAETDTKPSLQ